MTDNYNKIIIILFISIIYFTWLYYNISKKGIGFLYSN